jgi:hypothetical protein
VHLLAHSKGDTVCHYYSQADLAHHRNGGSTFRLILCAAVETSLEVTLCTISTAAETAFF